MSDITPRRAAEVLREYAGQIEESEIHHSGPMKGRCDPEIEEEIAEYRALAAMLDGLGATRAKGAHTDHPSRHWDRTCPACIAESALSAARFPSHEPCPACNGTGVKPKVITNPPKGWTP